MSKETAEKMLEAIQEKEKKLTRGITKKESKRKKSKSFKRLVN